MHTNQQVRLNSFFFLFFLNMTFEHGWCGLLPPFPSLFDCAFSPILFYIIYDMCSCLSYCPPLFYVSIQQLTSSMIHLSFFHNKLPDGRCSVPYSWDSSFSAFFRACGTTEDEILSSITFKSLSTSLQKLFPQSFSLAFCQFSRLSNDLSDRSKSSGWDLRSLRKLGKAALRNLTFARQYAMDPLLWSVCLCAVSICLLVWPSSSRLVRGSLSGNLSAFYMSEVEFILNTLPILATT